MSRGKEVAAESRGRRPNFLQDLRLLADTSYSHLPQEYRRIAIDRTIFAMALPARFLEFVADRVDRRAAKKREGMEHPLFGKPRSAIRQAVDTEIKFGSRTPVEGEVEYTNRLRAHIADISTQLRLSGFNTSAATRWTIISAGTLASDGTRLARSRRSSSEGGR